MTFGLVGAPVPTEAAAVKAAALRQKLRRDTVEPGIISSFPHAADPRAAGPFSRSYRSRRIRVHAGSRDAHWPGSVSRRCPWLDRKAETRHRAPDARSSSYLAGAPRV